MKNETLIFNVDEFEDLLIKDTLSNVVSALSEKGYNSINQVVGYLTSGDLAYISSYKNSRNQLAKIDREKIIEFLRLSIKDEKQAERQADRMIKKYGGETK